MPSEAPEQSTNTFKNDPKKYHRLWRLHAEKRFFYDLSIPIATNNPITPIDTSKWMYYCRVCGVNPCIC